MRNDKSITHHNVFPSKSPFIRYAPFDVSPTRNLVAKADSDMTQQGGIEKSIVSLLALLIVIEKLVLP